MAAWDDTPLFLLDLRRVRSRIAFLKARLPEWEVYYAMKALPHREVLSLCREEGIGFEVASRGELEEVAALGAAPGTVVTGNPVKTPDFLLALARQGVRFHAADSEEEIERIARVHTGAAVLVRISVSNRGSLWPLERKFGVDPVTAGRLLRLCREKGLSPAGVCFHVGSQCLDPAAFESAFETAHDLYKCLVAEGLPLEALNAGGGLPARGPHPLPPAAEYVEVFRRWTGRFRRLLPGIRLQMEPGRFLVGEAGSLITRVIGRTQKCEGRGGGVQQWLTTDVGVYSGLSEALGGYRYVVRLLDRRGEASVPFQIWGPTCDSMDIWGKDVLLPADTRAGDRLLIGNCGAYSLCTATRFNGLPIPRPVILGGD